MAYNQVPGGQQEKKRPTPLAPISMVTISTSETEPLLGGRSTPPPRYSTIGPSWEKGAQERTPLGHNDNLTTANTPPATVLPSAAASPPAPYVPPGAASTVPTLQTHTQSRVDNPGWWTWIPGPAQLFPPGLEHIIDTDSLLIIKKGRRRYRVMKANQQIYSVRRYKQGDGGVTLKIQNNALLDVLNLSRTKEAQGCCSYNTHVEVSFPPGNMVGVVQGGKMKYTVHNPSGDLLFIIERENSGCRGKPGYQVANTDRVVLGRLGCVRTGCCSGRKSLQLSFPYDLDLRCKALLLAGAVSLRDTHW